MKKYVLVFLIFRRINCDIIAFMKKELELQPKIIAENNEKTTMRETLFVPEHTDRGERLLDLSSRLLRDRVIFLIDPIDSIVAKQICAQLLILQNDHATKEIFLYINNCPGGEVYAALCILDFMRRLSCPIHTLCAGLVASAAVIIAACGQRGHRYALPSARIMMHQPHGGAKGQATDIEIQVREILLLKKYMAEILSERCQKKLEELMPMMERDYYMSAQEAVELGIVDEVLGGTFDKSVGTI